jgi:hypothetical protein
LATGLQICAFPGVVAEIVIHPAAEELHCHLDAGDLAANLRSSRSAADLANITTLAFTIYRFTPV